VAEQVAAGGITNTQSLDKAGVVQATLTEVFEGLVVAVELGLVESYRLLEDFELGGRGGRELLSEARDGLMEGKVKIQLGKPNEVAAPSTTVAEEQVLGSIHIEGRTCFRMQETESDELLPSTRRAKAPVVPSQVVEQGKLALQFFRFLPHRAVLASTARVGVGRRSFQARMVGRAKKVALSDVGVRAPAGSGLRFARTGESDHSRKCVDGPTNRPRSSASCREKET